MKNVLCLMYHFPPLGGVPVMRSLRLVRYLGDFGWQPTVATCEAGFDVIHGTDPSLASKVPPGVTVLRVPDPLGRWFTRLQKRLGARTLYHLDRLAKVLCFPDEKVLWGRRAYRAARKHLRARGPVDLIYATGFPWTAFAVAVRLGKRLGVPVVTDFRDAWTLNPTPVWRAFFLHALLEKRVLARSDRVLFATEGLRQEYARTYPQHAEKMRVVPNGYDPLDFVGHEADAGAQTAGTEGRCKIIYAGSLSDAVPPKPRSRSLAPFLEGLATAKQSQPELWARLQVEVFSNDVPQTRALAHRLGVAEKVTFRPRVAHAEILPRLYDADVLLLIVMRDWFARYIATAKIYEYIAVGRPILAIAPRDSEAARILQAYDLGVVLTHREARDGLAAAIASLLSRGRNGPNGKLEAAQAAFNGRNLVQTTAELFEQVSRT